ncbi:MAG: (2Fe-2S)-binding protein [Acidimicrobiia bacterium]
MIVHLTVNGREMEAPLSSSESLLFVLRERLGLPGSKNACEQGECGSCSVVLDGDLVCSCLVMAADTEGSKVITIEGLAAEEELHPVQAAILEAGGVQCGFCTPGLVVAAAELFRRNPSPSREDIREALAGNICRCTGYGAIVRGLEALAAASRSPYGGGTGRGS